MASLLIAFSINLVELTIFIIIAIYATSPRGRCQSRRLGIVADQLDDDEVRLRPELRRGRSLVNCEAEVVDPEGRLVAKALATYKVG
jgi:hypothetical protein